MRDAQPRDVLAALLGDDAVVVRRSGSMLSVRPEQGAFVVPPAPAVPAVPAPPPAPVVQATPPVFLPPMVPPVPPATNVQREGDRVSAGNDIVVRAGERVHDAVSMGGDIVVEGEVTGDAVSMGGDIRIRRGGVVRGNTVTMGGELIVENGANMPARSVSARHGPTIPIGPAARLIAHKGPSAEHGWFSDLLGSLTRYLLLFVLGLVLRAAAFERLGALQRTLVRMPARSGATGLVGVLGAVVLAIVLAITIIGIPGAVVVALALPTALYIGMAAVASVLGAALPLKSIKDLPAMQLAAGVAVLFLVSRVPVVGTLATVLVALAGLGAVIQTRFGKVAPGDLGADPVPGAGPFRTSAM